MADRAKRIAGGVAVALLTIGCGWTGQAKGASIGINFIGLVYGNTGTIASPSDEAGAVPQANFNQFDGSTVTAGVLNDNSGLRSSATLDVPTTAGVGIYAEGITGTDPNSELMSGYIDPFGASASMGITFTVSNLPYSSYDVYIYSASDHNGDRTSYVTVNGAQTHGLLDQYDPATGFVLSDPTHSGNYELFTGQSLSTLTVNILNGGTGIAGLQIVDTTVPEPATLSIMGIGAAALLRRRRKA